MAHQPNTARQPAASELDRSPDLADGLSDAQTARADQVDAAALPVAVRPDGALSTDGRFRWSAGWGRWVPTGREEKIDLPGPLEWGPLMPEKLHSRGCWCADCWSAGIRYADYVKAKAVRERNGF